MKKYAILLLKISPILMVLGFIASNLFTFGVIDHPGKAVYELHCADCHSKDGRGVRQLIPPLVNADVAIAKFDSIPCWIKNGMNGALMVNGVLYNQPMYPIKLNEVEVANVMNYIAKEFLKTEKQIKSETVKQITNSCEVAI